MPQEAKQKKQRKSNQWRDHKTCKTMTEAQEYLIEKGFSKRDRKVDKDRSVKTKYRCKFAKRRAANPCASEYRIFEPSDEKDKFIIQSNGLEHNHGELKDGDVCAQFSFEMVDLICDLSTFLHSFCFENK